MISGGQEFALIVIGMAMFSGVMRTAVRAKHGLPDRDRGGRHARRENSGEVDTLRSENKRLTDQVETMQDRLIVLEKIVTDRGYTLASEIEALRDRKPARDAEEKL